MDKERRVWVVRRGQAARRALEERRHEESASSDRESRVKIRRVLSTRRKTKRRGSDSEVAG